MGLTKKDAYEILGVSPGALISDITVSYKRLALQWYPQENKYSPQSVEKFKQISHAFKMLTIGGSDTNTSMADMLKLFQDVFTRQLEEYSDDSYDDDDDDEYLYFEDGGNRNSVESLKEKNDIAMKKGNELIEEEEKEKKKAEKRKAKKKRQKLKKKQEKEMAKKQNKKISGNIENKKQEEAEEQKPEESGSSDSEEEDIDPNSAFVALAASKMKINNFIKKDNAKKSEDNLLDECVYTETIILQSRQLAARAIVMANAEQYQAAIDLFTEAIKLYPKDFRYFGNRSYCFDRITQYERALKDSEKAIQLSPQWAKGYFRKGRALCGLRKYSEAESCFETVLKLDKECSEALQELTVIRMLQLIEMGFSKQQAEAALKDNKSVQEALEMLVNGNVLGKMVLQQQTDSGDDEIYQSDEDDFILATNKNFKTAPADEKLDPRNVGGHTSLWVGNITPEVTEKALTALFRKFGDVWIRILPEKSCAFVNFTSDKSAPGRAMKALQGKEIGGAQLYIRFPDHPHSVGQEAVTVLRKKGPSIPIAAAAAAAAAAKHEEKPKLRGPVSGNECYFFRTTGCVYGNNCRYVHVKEHQGIDFKKR